MGKGGCHTHQMDARGNRVWSASVSKLHVNLTFTVPRHWPPDAHTNKPRSFSEAWPAVPAPADDRMYARHTCLVPYEAARPHVEGVRAAHGAHHLCFNLIRASGQTR